MYAIRRADREQDINYVLDIDTKAFYRAWLAERWEQVLLNNLVFVNTWYGTPVGFIVLRFHPDAGYSQIVKFAVKPGHQRKGLGSNLIDTAYRVTALKRCRQTQCIVPEPWLFTDDGKLAKFLKHNRLAAQKPFIRDAFNFGGEVMDGVRFVYPE